ncbi:MAG: hypothetical protein ABL917_02100, partial [Parcubacteria group bacterium]
IRDRTTFKVSELADIFLVENEFAPEHVYRQLGHLSPPKEHAINSLNNVYSFFLLTSKKDFD